MAFLEICTFRDHDCKVIFREEVSFQQSNTRNKLPLKFDIKLFVFIVCYTLRAGYLVVSEISVFIFLFEQNTILFVRRHGAEHWFLHEEKQNRVSILFYDIFSKLMIFTKKSLYSSPKISAQVIQGVQNVIFVIILAKLFRVEVSFQQSKCIRLQTCTEN